MTYWLFKTEPTEFSFSDLLSAPSGVARWDGIRNYQARNFLRDQVKKGDLVFLYHSSVKEPGIFGLGEIVSDHPYPDPSALDSSSPYFDELSQRKGQSRWVSVDIRARHAFENPVFLSQIKESPELKDFLLLKKGNRLSVFPVPDAYAGWILKEASRSRDEGVKSAQAK